MRKRIQHCVASSESKRSTIVSGESFGKPAKIRLENKPTIGLSGSVRKSVLSAILANKRQDEIDNALFLKLSVMPERRILTCLNLAWIAKMAKGLHRKNEKRIFKGKYLPEKKYESGIRPLSR